MSLCDKDSGLLKTHVHWEDVEEAFSSTYGVPCKMGPNRKLSRIGVNKGFISRIALIDPYWLNPLPELPNRFCLKICSQLEHAKWSEGYAWTKKMEGTFKMMHNSEVDMYEIFEKYRTPSKLKASKLYAARRFSADNPSKGFLIIPFYENLEEVHIMDNMTIAEVEQVLEAIVEMNLITLKLSEEDLNKFEKARFLTLFGTANTPRLVDIVMGKVRYYLGKQLPELCNRLDEIRFSFSSMEAFNELDGLCSKLGMRPVITHGDLWSTNLLWSKREEEYQLEAIVDYQCPALSTPAIDICSFICSSLSGTDRLANIDYILGRYFEILKSKVPAGNVPFTLEQLKTSYIHVFPLHAFEILRTLLEIYAVEDPYEENEEIVLEKASRLLESIVDYYDQSKRLKSAHN